MKLITFVLLLFLFITGCGEVNCPAFPNNFLGWFPLLDNTILKYNNNGVVAEYTVNESIRSEHHSFKKNCDCSCNIMASFQTSISAQSLFLIRAFCNYPNDTQINFTFTFSDSTHSDQYYLSYDKTTSEFRNIDYTQNFTIENQTYTNVAVIGNTTNSFFVKKIYFSTEKGVIAYVDKNDREWKIVD
jgi:hypothetical protein